jgi:uncharacterized membrane protein YtjA (UPF0391 family)
VAHGLAATKFLTEPITQTSSDDREVLMLRWAITFAIIAIIAAGLGFSGVAGMSSDLAKLFALVFLVLFVVSLVAGRRFMGGPTV